MIDDAKLQLTRDSAAEIERCATRHMAVSERQATEYVMAAEVRRQAIALKKACEKWADARAYRATLTNREGILIKS
jgi:hypothetical protein